ncbi:hypothetical protein [Tibeticola sp.]|uniref:hypothetical protein n=1 Tax=Tibeticola sp. TaxID=2005368 RepID=UPI0025856F57|nr:hypothetical protein [Tibeticola sp.]MCI4441055.1 hypothetical protein [Tibeticola sp.]
MNTPADPFEAQLARELQDSIPAVASSAVVLRRAQRRVAARNVTTLLLGRIWLALARLLAPAAARLHRLSQAGSIRR